jgi:hypothetical protein
LAALRMALMARSVRAVFIAVPLWQRSGNRVGRYAMFRDAPRCVNDLGGF